MPRAIPTKGECAYCHKELSKGGVTKHLAACPDRKAAIEKAEAAKGVATEPLFHLRVQSADASAFWLDLEVRGSAKLKAVDAYLRAIWLECCGHMSEFSVGAFGGRKFAMTRQVGEVFAPGLVVTHIYDFGTSSETLLKLVGAREGKPTTAKGLALLARNRTPESQCIECGEPARWFCQECVIEDETQGTLCDAHKETHEHEDYGEPIPLVNSPRLGMCGYTGPAEPPY